MVSSGTAHLPMSSPYVTQCEWSPESPYSKTQHIRNTSCGTFTSHTKAERRSVKWKSAKRNMVCGPGSWERPRPVLESSRLARAISPRGRKSCKSTDNIPGDVDTVGLLSVGSVLRIWNEVDDEPDQVTRASQNRCLGTLRRCRCFIYEILMMQS